MHNRSHPCEEWLKAQSSKLINEHVQISLCQPEPFIQLSFYRNRPIDQSLLNGVVLPVSARHVGRMDGTRIYRLAPEIFGFYACSSNLQAQLLKVDSAVAAVVDLSHARVRVKLSGSYARQVLSLGISVDLDPDEFKPGEFIQTILDHNPVLLERTSDNEYELMFLRTFALTQVQWVVDAMQAS